MCVIYITRFSLVVTSMLTSTRTGSYSEYLKYLFSDERMNVKFKLFESITLPSIVNQLDLKNVYWIICVSNKMPERYLNRLNNLIKPYDFIKTLTFKDNEDVNDNIISTKLFQAYKNKIKATIRLDDDDGLSRCHTKNVKKYMQHRYLDHILGFKSGLSYNYNLDKCETIYFPKSIPAVGCCFYSLNKTIYGCGSHSNYEKKYKCIVDKKKISWIISDSDISDSERNKNEDQFKYTKSIDLINKHLPHINIK